MTQPSETQSSRLDQMRPALGLLAAVVTPIVVVISGYFFPLVLLAALIIGGFLATRRGWRQWSGYGMLLGCLLVFMGVLVNYE